jgi:peptide methionine sulfoxide reductase msrA/msrB
MMAFVKKKLRVFWGALVIILLLIVSLAVMDSRFVLLGRDSNSHLDKSSVTSDTPYIVLGMGCFWGAEKRMQALTGVLDVEAGYAGGESTHPTYESIHHTEEKKRKGGVVTNHAEVVKVFYDPKILSLEQVLIQFWESHNPTQGNRQGNDQGSNYRSAIFYRTDSERLLAERTRATYQKDLVAAGRQETITTEIAPLVNYTAAEEDHQDYLEKNPLGYCGIGGIGVAYMDLNNPSKVSPDRLSQPDRRDQDSKVDWEGLKLNSKLQLIAFEAEGCGYCRQFDREVLSKWSDSIPLVAVNTITPPEHWVTKGSLVATPTIILFRNEREVQRYTGYQGKDRFMKWLRESRSALE